MKHVKVLCAHPSNDLYGSDLMFVRSVKALEHVAYDTVAALPANGDLADRIRDDAPKVRVVNAKSLILQKRLLSVRRIPGAIYDGFAGILRVCKIIRLEKPDFVYVNTVTLPCWVIASALMRKKTVVHVREAEDSMNFVVGLLLLSPLLLASKLIANSEYTAQYLSERISVLGSKTVVVYNGIELPQAEHQEKLASFDIVLVGRISERKGQDVAVRALSLLRDQGHELKLAIVGSCHDDAISFFDEVKALVRSLNMTEYVHFLGFDSNPLKYLHNRSIAIVPSRVEPFGNVALEAMSQGAAVVASRVGGLQEIVRDGVDGLLFESGNAVDLAEKINFLLTNKTVADRVRNEGQKSARIRFGPERYRSELLAALVSVGTR